MRQYRGLTKEGEWVYGWYVDVEGLCFIIPEDATIHNQDTEIMGFIGVMLQTVGQFTGLNDKYGKEIYEGDIVKAFEKNYEVVFNQTESGLSVNYGYPDKHNGPTPYWVEVIGNIHENPELLEAKNVKS